jgi:hypothetical protein
MTPTTDPKLDKGARSILRAIAESVKGAAFFESCMKSNVKGLRFDKTLTGFEIVFVCDSFVTAGLIEKEEAKIKPALAKICQEAQQEGFEGVKFEAAPADVDERIAHHRGYLQAMLWMNQQP